MRLLSPLASVIFWLALTAWIGALLTAGIAAACVFGALAPGRVVYVSCDPPTLGRDLKHFQAAGYRIDRIELFDMFPDTLHLETVVALSR